VQQNKREAFMKVLIGYDGSTHADAAIDDLERAGLPENVDATILSAIEWPMTEALRHWGTTETDFSPEWMERITAARELAERGADRLRNLFPRWNVRIEPSGGNPAESILNMAKTWPADLIVIGTHGRSALARVMLGSVSLKVMREAVCSVRVGRLNHHEGPTRLLIGMDGSEEAETALNAVCGRSWPEGSEARIVGVHEILIPINSERIAIGERIYEQTNEDEFLRIKHAAKEAADKVRAAGLTATGIVEEGDPKGILVRDARDWQADTIFVGARGLGRIEGLLLGSVSSATVAHAPCTVEVVRAPVSQAA
jgi:nucleotide-binding universal stress UspA family protein